jgi:hypothetical protein
MNKNTLMMGTKAGTTSEPSGSQMQIAMQNSRLWTVCAKNLVPSGSNERLSYHNLREGP